jgi:O-antigen/teichoic acid export membrane protein
MSSKLKALLSDTAVYGVSTIIGRFLTFLLTPLYTNYLLPDELGIFVAIFSYIAFVNIAFSFGMESSFFRFYDKDSIEKTKKVFSITFFTILSIASTLILVFHIGIVPFVEFTSLQTFTSPSKILLYSSLIPFFDCIMIIPFALLRMQRKAKKFAGIKIIGIVVNVAANIYFVVFEKMGIEGALLSGIVSSLVGVLFVLPELKHYLRPLFEWTLFKELAQFGLPTLPSGFASMMLQVADRPILLFLTNAQIVAIYNVNYRLGIPMMLATTVFEYAWKPFYLTHSEDSDAPTLFSRVFTLYNLYTCIVFLLSALFIEYLIQIPIQNGTIINEQYWIGVSIIPVILFGYMLYGMYANFSAGIYIAKQTSKLPLITGSAAIVNAIGVYVLSQFYSYNGAAWATVLAYATSSAIMYYYSQKAFPIPYEWKKVALLFIFTFFLYFTSKIFTTLEPSVLNFTIRLCVFPILFVLLYISKFFRPDELLLFKKLLFRK